MIRGGRVQQRLADLVEQAVRASAGSAHPDHAVTEVGWRAGYRRGFAAGLVQTARSIAEQAHRLARAPVATTASPSRAARQARDLAQLQRIASELADRPDPAGLAPPGPALPRRWVVVLAEAAGSPIDGDEPPGRVARLVAQAWRLGAEAGRDVGTVTAVNRIAGEAHSARVRRIAGQRPAVWAAHTLAPARTRLSRVLGPRAARRAGLLAREPEQRGRSPRTPR